MADTTQTVVQKIELDFGGAKRLADDLRRARGEAEAVARAANQVNSAGGRRSGAGYYGIGQKAGTAMDYRRMEEAEERGRQAEERAKARADFFSRKRDQAGYMAAGAVVGLSALANPIATDRFRQAVADLGAVIGRDLVPVVEKLTSGVRSAADWYVSRSQDTKDIVSSGIAGLGAYGGLRLLGVGARFAGPIGVGVGMAQYGSTLADANAGAGRSSDWRDWKFRMGSLFSGDFSSAFSSNEERWRGVMGLREGDSGRRAQARQLYAGQTGAEQAIAARFGSTSWGASGMEAGYTSTEGFLTALRSSAFANATRGGALSDAARAADGIEEMVTLLQYIATGNDGGKPVLREAGPATNMREHLLRAVDAFRGTGNDGGH